MSHNHAIQTYTDDELECLMDLRYRATRRLIERASVDRQFQYISHCYTELRREVGHLSHIRHQLIHALGRFLDILLAPKIEMLAEEANDQEVYERLTGCSP
ncbi:hypothetical protein N7491_010407 [Penicillium cf. griseofulvum]|uniref:Uncharacterized protein n=1 Tax=Penicillium cf. griseofulvum TaxID=2972120 RepID=A0A9W9N061_9EURO|nr:hypothetical protein N7472_000739 [Penicillium cf. griseofulvum]KAJ5421962.1 hypothetical protein N7491_010407 [Penicillium cf. griseofulvum]KAJ5428153.1 hypothetical protein N7445_009607 [Penicillium cf. griseofulvum]